jgi:hypothetical protein
MYWLLTHKKAVTLTNKKAVILTAVAQEKLQTITCS